MDLEWISTSPQTATICLFVFGKNSEWLAIDVLFQLVGRLIEGFETTPSSQQVMVDGKNRIPTPLFLPKGPYLVGGLVAINSIFPYIGNFIIPIDELIFFRGVAQPPTSY